LTEPAAATWEETESSQETIKNVKEKVPKLGGFEDQPETTKQLFPKRGKE